ncbi:MAG: hypothetical protein WBN57_09970 [Gammaproteobacteria bacterium]|jgi:hypothetical protein
MAKSMKGNKINNNALEVIMRDVLHGMADFTRDSSCGSELGNLEIVAVESPQRQSQATARILPFPTAGKTAAKK